MSETVVSRSLELRGVAVALWSLAATATALRVYVRVGILKNFAVEDWIMLVALLSYSANTSTAAAGSVFGSGRHMNDLDPKDAQTAMMLWWACYPTYAVAMIASKFSVGFFLLRITTQRVHRWIIFVAMALTAASGTAFFFVAIFQCNPVSYSWDKVSQTGTCLSVDAIISVTCAYSSFAIITDFTFTLLPAWLVLNLQMDKKTKMALVPILGMACIASSAVAVRLAYINDFRNPDFLWATTDIAIWSQTEQGLAIAAGSFATLRPLFRILLSKVGLSSSDTSPSDGSGSAGHKGGHYNFKIGDSNYSERSRRLCRSHEKSNHDDFDEYDTSAAQRDLGGPWRLSTFNRRMNGDFDGKFELDDEEKIIDSTTDLTSPSPPSSSSASSPKDAKPSPGDYYRVQIVSKSGQEHQRQQQEREQQKHQCFTSRMPAPPCFQRRNESDDDRKKLQIHCSKEFGSSHAI